MEDSVYREQNEIFERLYVRVGKLLEKFGRQDSLLRSGDYSVYGDYWGYPQIKVTVSNLALLRPNVVGLLREIIKDFPDWEIVVAIAVREHYHDWPEMGLYIRPHEIVDGLQRQYFPKEFQDIHYEGSRPGTDRD